MLGHTTLRKHLHFGGHKGPVRKAYVHRASKGSNPLGVLDTIQASKMEQYSLRLYRFPIRISYLRNVH
jgi:hypothetical protein